ncbi:MAG: hypothetical protein ACRETL_07480 [Gammaproteobacteria bacterium]
MNFHRPCGYATVRLLKRGKKKRVYPAGNYRTPYEKLISLNGWERYLKPGITAESLKLNAAKMSGTDAALRMQKIKNALLTKTRGIRSAL